MQAISDASMQVLAVQEEYSGAKLAIAHGRVPFSLPLPITEHRRDDLMVMFAYPEQRAKQHNTAMKGKVEKGKSRTFAK